MNTSKISAKEWLFCNYFVKTNNARESAAKAGYAIFPEKSGEKLLKKTRIKNEIKKMQKANESDIYEVEIGLKRLAFGSTADAIRIILDENIPLNQLDMLDLYNISEIKKARGGGVEIKFFDRLKALERLKQLCDGKNTGSAELFFEALREKTLNEED